MNNKLHSTLLSLAFISLTRGLLHVTETPPKGQQLHVDDSLHVSRGCLLSNTFISWILTSAANSRFQVPIVLKNHLQTSANSQNYKATQT